MKAVRKEINYSDNKDDEGLSWVNDKPEVVSSKLIEAFAAKEDESHFLKRIKNSPRKIVVGGVTGIIAERSFQALGMAYRALRNSLRYKQGQTQSVEGALAIPTASKGLFKMFAR
jgi:hypothetical protein